MMITKRQFGVSIVIFLTLLLLFMGFQIGKEAGAAHDRNNHFTSISNSVKGNPATPDFVSADETGKPDGLTQQDEWVLYLGKENSKYAATVKEWSYYTKIPAVFSKELPEESATALPDIIMIEPEYVKNQSQRITTLMKKGVDFVFLALPDYRYIQSDFSLRKILGIRRTIKDEIHLKGMHLFKGFLLGGERIFEANTEEEEKKRQDLDLDIPWYSVRKGTKTFMRGTLTDEDLSEATEKKYKNEDMPAIIWRSHYENGEAYAVNGDYLKNRRAGLGILQAMMYERKDYSVYPVINAQVFSVDCFPLLSDENQAEVKKIYGRTVTKSQTDIIMPMLITLSAKYEKKTSCFMSVKCNRNDSEQPQNDILKKYMSMIDEMGGELSMSSNYRGQYSKAEELKSDFEFFNSHAPDYQITAVMSPSHQLSKLQDDLNSAGAKDIRTISTSKYSESLPVIGYLNDSITFQQTTSDLMKHTFTDELELLGIQTLLAYSNGYYNMADAFYPKSEKEEWQNSSREVFSNLTTYNNPFITEDCLTVSESDARIRTYFNLQYDVERNGNVVTISYNCGSENGKCCFILRTHNEKIESVSGGDFKEIEENAYLISTKQEKVEIRLSSTLSALVDMEGSNR